MNGQRGSVGGIMIRIASVLFSLVLISTAMMAGLYAKYVARGNGDDGARVAKFSVSASLDDGDADKSKNNITVNISDGVDVAAGENAFTVTVTNNSEVAVEYDIVVTLTGDRASGATANIEDANVTKSGNTYTFSSASWVLAPNNKSATHTLTFDVANQDTFTEHATGESYSSSFEFKVVCNFVQVD